MIPPRVSMTLDLSALEHNVSVLRAHLAAHTQLLAMVKADAYGHGMRVIARHLLPLVDGFGVATIEEAMVLREQGIRLPVVVMSGFYHPHTIAAYVEQEITPVIHDLAQIAWLEQATLSKPLSVWLKVDTGMHRLGIHPKDFSVAWARLQAVSGVRQPIGVMSHLADASTPEAAVTVAQRACFERLLADLDCPKSLCNSAGIFTLPAQHYDWVRPGIALYGVSPFSGPTAPTVALQPVMTLSARILEIKQCHPGDTIGYDATYTCKEAMPIAIVGIGYGDGYPRHIAPDTPVLIDGLRCPIVGRVSMDMLAVDLRPLSQVPDIGDSVVLWGKGLPVAEIAEFAGTIPYELFSQLTRRLQPECLQSH